MTPVRARAAVLAATVISTLALTAPTASAQPSCSDPVARTAHAVHAATGDPAGAGHAVEETYCGAKP